MTLYIGVFVAGAVFGGIVGFIAAALIGIHNTTNYD